MKFQSGKLGSRKVGKWVARGGEIATTHSRMSRAPSSCETLFTAETVDLGQTKAVKLLQTTLNPEKL